MTRIGVVIPTVNGRERELERAIRTHCPPYAESEHEVTFGVRVETDFDTCGEAWNSGVRKLLALDEPPDFLLLTADDLEPRYADWYLAAIGSVERGHLPGARTYDAAGVEQNTWGRAGEQIEFPRVPFLPLALAAVIFPIPNLHYYSDVWIGGEASALGWETRLVDRFAFLHHWAQAGRIVDDTSDRLLYDAELARRGVA